MCKLQILAFYLPQFHPFKENDEWWGKGFTEWTNVGKAKPLFKGHNQPRVPTELGYYDLRLPIIREQQAQMARDAGVTAFCYWHYWFGNGKRLIPEVFEEVLTSGSPDFPFCLGWANHSWYAKNWNSDGSITQKLLMEQTYPGVEDEKMHFKFLLRAFQDPRYVKVDGAPLLYIFAPKDLPKNYLDDLRKWTKEAGFPDLFLVAKVSEFDNSEEIALNNGYNAISFERIYGALKVHKGTGWEDRFVRKIQEYSRKVLSFTRDMPPFVADYSQLYHKLINEKDKEENVIPALLPQWDHSPRSGKNGSIMINATPEYFYLHVKEALDIIKNKKRKILFLKSWNEWGEGNMMEPDITYGRGFIEALKKAIEEF